MTLIVLVAVGISALRFASDLWAGLLLLATLATLGTAILGVVYRRESKRAFALGFVLFGGGYLVMAIGPWFADHIEPRLPTTQALARLHSQVASRPTSMTLTSTAMPSGGSTIPLPNKITVDHAIPIGTTGNYTYIKRLVGFATPGASNYQPFLRVGHCLFAFLAGLMGGWVARWFQRTSPVV
jgi:hypothetical protein